MLGRDGAGSGHSLLRSWVDVNSDSEYGSIKLIWQPSDFTMALAYFPQAEHEFARERVDPIPGSTLKSFHTTVYQVEVESICLPELGQPDSGSGLISPQDVWPCSLEEPWRPLGR